MNVDERQRANLPPRPDPGVWLAVGESFEGFSLALEGEASIFRGIKEGHWLVVSDSGVQ